MKIQLPKSVRKYIRKEKARIRREILDIQKQEEAIKQLYEKFLEHSNIKENFNKNSKK